MSSYVNKKERVFLPAGDAPPPQLQRVEGRMKTYMSCTDIRAWELEDEPRRQHLLDLLNNAGGTQPLGQVVPLEIIISTLIDNALDRLQKILKAYEQLELTPEQLAKLAALLADYGIEGYGPQGGDFESKFGHIKCAAKRAQLIEQAKLASGPPSTSAPEAERTGTSGPAGCAAARSVPAERGPSPGAVTRGMDTAAACGATLGDEFDTMSLDQLKSKLREVSQELREKTKIAVEAVRKLERVHNQLFSNEQMLRELSRSHELIKTLRDEMPGGPGDESNSQQMKKEIQVLKAYCQCIAGAQKELIDENDRLKVELESQTTDLRCAQCRGAMEDVQSSGLSPSETVTALRNLRDENNTLKQQLMASNYEANELTGKMNASIIKIAELKTRITEFEHHEPERSVQRERSLALDGVMDERDRLREHLERVGNIQDKLLRYKLRAKEADELEREKNRLQDDLDRLKSELREIEIQVQDMSGLRLQNETLTRHLESIKAERDEMKVKICQQSGLESTMKDLECKLKDLQSIQCERDMLRMKVADFASVQEEIDRLRFKSKQAEVLRCERDRLKERVEDLSAMEVEFLRLVEKTDDYDRMKEERTLFQQKFEELLAQRCVENDLVQDFEEQNLQLMQQIDRMSRETEEQKERTNVALRDLRMQIETKNCALASYKEKIKEFDSLRAEMCEIQTQLMDTIERLESEKEQTTYEMITALLKTAKELECSEKQLRCLKSKMEAGKCQVVSADGAKMKLEIAKLQENCSSLTLNYSNLQAETELLKAKLNNIRSEPDERIRFETEILTFGQIIEQQNCELNCLREKKESAIKTISEMQVKFKDNEDQLTQICSQCTATGSEAMKKEIEALKENCRYIAITQSDLTKDTEQLIKQLVTTQKTEQTEQTDDEIQQIRTKFQCILFTQRKLIDENEELKCRVRRNEMKSPSETSIDETIMKLTALIDEQCSELDNARAERDSAIFTINELQNVLRSIEDQLSQAKQRKAPCPNLIDNELLELINNLMKERNDGIRTITELQTALKTVEDYLTPISTTCVPCGKKSMKEFLPCTKQSMLYVIESKPCVKDPKPCRKQSLPCAKESLPCAKEHIPDLETEQYIQDLLNVCQDIANEQQRLIAENERYKIELLEIKQNQMIKIESELTTLTELVDQQNCDMERLKQEKESDVKTMEEMNKAFNMEVERLKKESLIDVEKIQMRLDESLRNLSNIQNRATEVETRLQDTERTLCSFMSDGHMDTLYDLSGKAITSIFLTLKDERSTGVVLKTELTELKNKLEQMKAEPIPEAPSEEQPEPDAVVVEEPEPDASPEPEPEPEASPEPEPEPEALPKSEPEPEPVIEKTEDTGELSELELQNLELKRMVEELQQTCDNLRSQLEAGLPAPENVDQEQIDKERDEFIAIIHSLEEQIQALKAKGDRRATMVSDTLIDIEPEEELVPDETVEPVAAEPSGPVIPSPPRPPPPSCVQKVHDSHIEKLPELRIEKIPEPQLMQPTLSTPGLQYPSAKSIPCSFKSLMHAVPSKPSPLPGGPLSGWTDMSFSAGAMPRGMREGQRMPPLMSATHSTGAFDAPFVSPFMTGPPAMVSGMTQSSFTSSSKSDRSTKSSVTSRSESVFPCSNRPSQDISSPAVEIEITTEVELDTEPEIEAIIETEIEPIIETEIINEIEESPPRPVTPPPPPPPTPPTPPPPPVTPPPPPVTPPPPPPPPVTPPPPPPPPVTPPPPPPPVSPPPPPPPVTPPPPPPPPPPPKMDQDEKLKEEIETLKKKLKECEERSQKLSASSSENMGSLKSQYERDLANMLAKHNESVMRLQRIHEEELAEAQREFERELANALGKDRQLSLTNVGTVDIPPESSPQQIVSPTSISISGDQPETPPSGDKPRPCYCKRLPIVASPSLAKVLNKVLHEGMENMTFDDVNYLHTKVCKAAADLRAKQEESELTDEEKLIKRIKLLEAELIRKQKAAQEKMINLENAVKTERKRLAEMKRAFEDEKQRSSDLQEQMERRENQESGRSRQQRASQARASTMGDGTAVTGIPCCARRPNFSTTSSSNNAFSRTQSFVRQCVQRSQVRPAPIAKSVTSCKRHG